MRGEKVKAKRGEGKAVEVDRREEGEKKREGEKTITKRKPRVENCEE